jgi:hypothetical protein
LPLSICLQLQEGDEWLEEGGGSDDAEAAAEASWNAQASAPPPAGLFQDLPHKATPPGAESPTVAVSTPAAPVPAQTTPAPSGVVSVPSAVSAAAPYSAEGAAASIASKAVPGKAKAASNAMSNFFSLDAMQVRTKRKLH